MTWVLWTLASLTFVTIILGLWPLLGSLLHSEALEAPLFERWLEPVTGAATASLPWLSETAHATLAGITLHAWELITAGCSVGLTLGTWAVTRALYKDGKSTVPARLLANPSPLLRNTYQLIYNKYWVDELYDWAIVRRMRDLARFLFAFDQKIIDGLVNLAGKVGKVVGYIDGAIDALIVDGAVNGVAALFAAAGRWVRRSQTGRIQTYLAGAVAGVLILVFINFVVFQFM